MCGNRLISLKPTLPVWISERCLCLLCFLFVVIHTPLQPPPQPPPCHAVRSLAMDFDRSLSWAQLLGFPVLPASLSSSSCSWLLVLFPDCFCLSDHSASGEGCLFCLAIGHLPSLTMFIKDNIRPILATALFTHILWVGHFGRMVAHLQRPGLSRSIKERLWEDALCSFPSWPAAAGTLAAPTAAAPRSVSPGVPASCTRSTSSWSSSSAASWCPTPWPTRWGSTWVSPFHSAHHRRWLMRGCGKHSV